MNMSYEIRMDNTWSRTLYFHLQISIYDLGKSPKPNEMDYAKVRKYYECDEIGDVTAGKSKITKYLDKN